MLRGHYPFESERYLELGAWRFKMYAESSDMKDLDQSIEAYDQALLYMPPEHPDGVRRNFKLAKVPQARSDMTNSSCMAP